MREKYTNNIAYLHKRVTTDNTAEWDENGIPFYCNRETVKKSRWSPQANTMAGTAEEVLKTTTQLEFEVNDKITFFSQPLNDVNAGDANLISAIEPIPYMERGNKQLTTNYYEYRITIG